MSKVENIQAVFREVNNSIQAGFMPTLPDGLHTAQLLSTGAERPLRVLSLGQSMEPQAAAQRGC